MKNILTLTILTLSLTACGGTWQTSDIDRKNAQVSEQETLSKKAPSSVVVTEGGISQDYETIGDIRVSVKKTTIFHADPTKEQATEALREKGASVGADAVINATYGDVGPGLMSWGSIEAEGTAVRYQ